MKPSRLIVLFVFIYISSISSSFGQTLATRDELKQEPTIQLDTVYSTPEFGKFNMAYAGFFGQNLDVLFAGVHLYSHKIGLINAQIGDYSMFMETNIFLFSKYKSTEQALWSEVSGGTRKVYVLKGIQQRKCFALHFGSFIDRAYQPEIAFADKTIWIGGLSIIRTRAFGAVYQGNIEQSSGLNRLNLGLQYEPSGATSSGRALGVRASYDTRLTAQNRHGAFSLLGTVGISYTPDGLGFAPIVGLGTSFNFRL